MENDAWFGHMVYFALREKSPEAVARLLSGCKAHLTGHPDTVLFAVGTRDTELNRDVNVQDFDVALQLVFASRAAHDAYQVHPRHTQFVAEQKANWATVRVFDAYVSR